ncbi:co-regulatory protein PtrA N-terminal domain-containing protein [Stutzerimonas stutzeri]|jgi:hypothetical protein|uniref:PepSY domain-containing protein n=1 Tax=Stutzerimonas stutzeri TaxID=316 RepID=A0A5S5BH49_STUST|nr:co-regulatory protein PtrA N-terminal domain-containing protein [Stutzerimonas stutzeri]TYP66319.1 hypothetical protein A9A72_121318 [Stutzerimonas stutzeri]
MKTATKLILSVVLTAASSLAMAEGGSDRTLNRINETSERSSTLNTLLKEGKVLSVGPAGTTGTTGMIQTYRTNGNVQPYEIKLEMPDGKIQTVEFLSAPVGVNNG